MTVALLLLSLPSAAALALMGLLDPKRRRSRGEPAATVGRRAAVLGLAACGLAAAVAGGAAALLVWAMAAAAVGWALSMGLARTPPAGLASADRAVAAWLGGTGSTRTGPRRSGSPHGLVARRFGPLAIPAALAALAALALAGSIRQAPPGSAATPRLLALGLLDRIDRGAADRRAATPCLAAVAAETAGPGLRDLLSGRDLAFDLPAGRGLDGPDIALQRCILAQGGEGAEVNRAGDRLRFTVTGETARRIAAAVTGQLVEADALAALSEDLGPAQGLLCRRLPEAVGTEIEDVVAALRRDALYAKADDLLRRLPALDRLVSARRAGIPCPP